MIAVKHPLTDKIVPLDTQVINNDSPLLGGHRVWLIVGRRGTGKSTLVLNALMKAQSPYHKHYDNIFMISPSAKADPKFADIVEELDSQGKFYEELSERTTKEILDKINAFNNGLSEKKRKKVHNLLILDDCAFMFPTSKKSVIHSLFVNGRHKKLSVWVVSQKYNLLPTVWRSQADMISMFPTESRQELETLMNDLSCDKSYFEDVYKFATDEPNSFLHITLTHPIRYYKRFDEIQFKQNEE
jgi:Cdc6-like AAA superfamily ATPase